MSLSLMVPKRVPPARVHLGKETRVLLGRLASLLPTLLEPNVPQRLRVLVHSKDPISRVVIKIFIIRLVPLKSPRTNLRTVLVVHSQLPQIINCVI
mmetsp:Transcript_10567/g.10633  ORF Transcript_10567/g.10633 Transcript_10567/m.10633 type:complete len:96 (-) Transcript_10567:10-297(-)